MCSVNVDGAAAAVLVSAKKARALGMSRSVKIRASALTSDPYSERNLTMPDVDTCTTNAANQAYELALHLRGEAGTRQQAGAKLGLAHVIGLGSCCAIHILEAPEN